MSVLTLTERPLGEQIEVLERGLPRSALEEIAAALGLPNARIIKALNLVLPRMSERERTGERFSVAESERLYRIVRVRSLAREIFSSDVAVAEWLSAADRSLGGRAPLEMLATDLGVQKVESLLRTMINGVPI